MGEVLGLTLEVFWGVKTLGQEDRPLHGGEEMGGQAPRLLSLANRLELRRKPSQEFIEYLAGLACQQSIPLLVEFRAQRPNWAAAL